MYFKIAGIITNCFLFDSIMPRSRGDKVILENGTVKPDRVAMRDLQFWLPHTKAHICDGVQYAPSFESLVKLPTPQIGFILAVIIKIIRKNRKVNGERLSNCTLKVKVDAHFLIKLFKLQME